ncbi:MAG: HAMP domain-containing histidine kinase [Desulfobacterales bacterium]|nr:HAMP domain-containing histidine kinase [Desulfobacterales bacterium]
MIYELAIVLTIGLLIILVAGGWLGLVTSRRVITPIAQLVEIVKKAGPDNLPTDLSRRFDNNEVGVLAGALERAMERVQAFMDREKIFTRDASHELRTPVTVIKGAVGVLERKYGKDEGPLQRINRSVKDMENTIESLLLLAREEAVPAPGESCSGAPEIRKAIDQNRYLLIRKPVTVNLVEKASPVIQAPAGMFRIAVTNLIRNAFTCTAEGAITVTLHEDHVEVADTGRGVPEKDLPRILEPHVRGSDSHGFGLGLSIVKRLCDRFGWDLAIDSREGSGTRVRLIFHANGGAPAVAGN